MERPNMIKRIGSAEMFSKVPLLELAGENRVLIENHQGVLAYSMEEIQIKVAYGKLLIAGSCLKIMQMSKEQLVISGRIDDIRLFRR